MIMHKKLLGLIGLIGLIIATQVLWALLPVARATAQDAGAGPDFAVIDAYVEAEMRANRVPGVGLAIVHGSQIVHMRGFGDDGAGQPVTPQTSFLLGSMSKAFTALAVMQLVEQGRVDLDAPVQRYLPWFQVADAGASPLITVRHALHHTTGLATRTAHASEAPLSIAAHVRVLAGASLAHPPGAVHEYASPNYLVLGAIIEQVAGQPYADYIEQQIFAPLAMQRSFTAQDAAMQRGMARGHRYWFGFPRPIVGTHEADRLPTAALIASAEDLGHFLIMQLGRGQYGGHVLLSPDSLAQMHTAGVQGEGFGYGMGWRISEIGGVPAVHHGGVVSHFRGKMVLLPGADWGVVVLTNVSSALPVGSTAHRLADNIAANLVGKPLPPADPSLSRVYLALALAVAVLTWLQIRDILRLGQWRQRLSLRPRRAVLAELAREFLIPLALVLGLPHFLELPWTEVLHWLPDIGAWMVLAIVVGWAVAIFKSIVFYRLRSP